MTERVLEDHTTAPIDEKLRAMLGYLKKVTLTPGEVSAGDARALRACGISRQAIVDALHVLFLFNTYDRLADALGWAVPRPEYFRARAPMMLQRGYR